MGDILGWGDVSKRVECLACHAVNLSQELTPGVPRPGRVPEVFHTADGVGCEACHGIGDKWFAPHLEKAWRSVTPEDKLTKFGERDMRNAEARAERCAACHHDLISPSERQKGRGSSGRPMPRTGPTTLLRMVAGGEAGGFDAKFAALVQACNAKPFGDPAKIADAAGELEKWADGVAKN